MLQSSLHGETPRCSSLKPGLHQHKTPFASTSSRPAAAALHGRPQCAPSGQLLSTLSRDRHREAVGRQRGGFRQERNISSVHWEGGETEQSRVEKQEEEQEAEERWDQSFLQSAFMKRQNKDPDPESLKGKIKSPKSFVEEKSEEVTKSRAEKPDSLTVPLRLSLRLCFTSQWDLTATQWTGRKREGVR